MKLTETTLQLSRERWDLDMDVIEFTHVLDDCSIDYVVVSGYVSILKDDRGQPKTSILYLTVLMKPRLNDSSPS